MIEHGLSNGLLARPDARKPPVLRWRAPDNCQIRRRQFHPYFKAPANSNFDCALRAQPRVRDHRRRASVRGAWSMRPDIPCELRGLSLAAQPSLLCRLRQLGVNQRTIAQMGNRHFFGGSDRVIDIDDGLYAPSANGEPHLILPVFENCNLVDLVAFTSDKPLAWLLRLGVGWSLGLLDGLERHSGEDEVRLWASPLDWLRAGCDGLCILDWSAPEILELARLPNIRCQDSKIAELLRDALTRPYRLPNITVCEDLQHAA